MPKRIPIRLDSPTKYRSKATVVDNVRFASQREAARYVELKLLLGSHKITQLTLQPKFELKVSGVTVCRYVADFVYYELPLWTRVVEDAKGVKTAVYKLKKKMLKAQYGIEIREV